MVEAKKIDGLGIVKVLEKNGAVQVTPLKWVEHKNYSDLVGIKGHKYFFVNLISGKITYIQNKVKIPTGERAIRLAKQKVEIELRKRATGKSEIAVKRELKGVTDPLFQEVWEEMLKEKQTSKAEATVVQYHVSFTHGLKPFMEGKTISEAATPENILNYKAWYLKTHPGRQFYRTLVHLGATFRFAVKYGYLARMPDISSLEDVDDTIDRNVQRVKHFRVATPAEETALTSAHTKLFKRPMNGVASEHREMLVARVKLAVLLGVRCGMRKESEILSLPWDKIYLDTKEAEVWSRKNKKWRRVPLPNSVVAAFIVQKKFTGQFKRVFPMPSDPERAIAGQVLDKMWHALKKAAGIKGRFRFHDLRHTFATRTAEAGWPARIACEILDMSMSEYERTYTHPGMLSKSKLMRGTFK